MLYRSRMNPSLGRNFEAMDPLEWLARMADHIPDPGKHRTHFYAYYAKRTRGSGTDKTTPPLVVDPAVPAPRERDSDSVRTELLEELL